MPLVNGTRSSLTPGGSLEDFALGRLLVLHVPTRGEATLHYFVFNMSINRTPWPRSSILFIEGIPIRRTSTSEPAVGRCRQLRILY